MRKILALCAAVGAVIIGSAMPAQAATASFKDFGFSTAATRTVSKYDITGDGKNDKIVMKMSGMSGNGSYSKVDIVVNGKDALNLSYPSGDGTFGISTGIVTLQNGKKYFYLADALMNDYQSVVTLYNYNNKAQRLIVEYDFLTMNNLYPEDSPGRILDYRHATIKGVSGNVITVDLGFQCSALAQVRARFKLSYRKGKLQLYSRYGNILTVGGKSVGTPKKLLVKTVAFKEGNSPKATRNFYKNSMLKISKLYIGNKILRFRVKNAAGRAGYIDCLKARRVTRKHDGVKYVTRAPLFEGLGYAG